jgi:hypothetical protein
VGIREVVDGLDVRVRVIMAAPVHQGWDQLREAADSGGLDPEEVFRYYGTFTYRDDNRRDWTLINTSESTTHVVLDGKAWPLDDYDALLDAVGVEDEAGVVQVPDGYPDEEAFRRLADVDPAGESSEGPAVCAWYPLDTNDADGVELALTLGRGALCVVEVYGQFGVALSSVGADLAWEIAAAHVRLGLLPPIHLAGLPKSGSPGDRDSLIAAAMRRSLDVAACWLVRDLAHLDGIEAWLAGDSRE